MSSEINNRTVLVSATGGEMDFVLDGEVLLSVYVPPGRVRASRYLDLVPEGCEVQLSKGLVAFQPRPMVNIQPYGEGSHDSGANPDFRPSSARRMEEQMRVTLARMQQATARVEARERALARVERVPQAPVEIPAPKPVADAPVVE